jgi:hypothetical protein
MQIPPGSASASKRCDVHTVAVNRAIRLLEHIAQVDANAEEHAARWRQCVIPGLKRLLDIDGALDGIDNAAEHGEHTVACRIHNPALMRGNGVFENIAVGAESGDRGLFVLAHQAGIADHVSTQDGCELTDGVLVCHGNLPARPNGLVAV